MRTPYLSIFKLIERRLCAHPGRPTRPAGSSKADIHDGAANVLEGWEAAELSASAPPTLIPVHAHDGHLTRPAGSPKEDTEAEASAPDGTEFSTKAAFARSRYSVP